MEQSSELKMVVINKYGKVGELELANCPEISNPGPGQLVVKIGVCGVNFSDMYTRVGLFQGKTAPKPPFTMGREAAGEVIEVGPEETNFKVGDRVACLSCKQGLWTSVALVEAADVVLLPDEMSLEDGAAIFVKYITAYSAVIGFGSLSPGQKVFIHSVGGGVGCAATQLAKMTPGVIVLGTSSKQKHEKLKELGVDHVFDRLSTDYIEEVLRLYPEGVDLIVDNRSGKDFLSARKMLSPLGKIVHMGANCVLENDSWKWSTLIKTFWDVRNVSLLDLVSSNHSVCGLNIDELKFKSPTKFKQIALELIQLYLQGKIKPQIDSIWKFQEVRIAVCKLISRDNVGTVLLKPY